MRIFNYPDHKGIELLGFRASLRRQGTWSPSLGKSSRPRGATRPLSPFGRRLLKVFALLGVVLGAGSLVTSSLARWNATFAGDVAFAEDIQSWHGAVARHLFQLTSDGSGGLQFFVTVMVLAAGLLVARRVLDAFFLVGTGASGVGSILLKKIVQRPRPSFDLINVAGKNNGASFPSNHVVVYTVLAGFLLFLLMRSNLPAWLKGALAVLVVLVAGVIDLSRVYLGAHWPSDVYGGLVVGLFMLCVLLLLYVFLKETLIYETGRDAEGLDTQRLGSI